MAKLMSMKEAIEKFVNDGDTLYIGGFIHAEPYAAVHEIIRQKKKGLTVSTAAGTLFLDQMIFSGCVDKIITSYIWNAIPRTAHAFRWSMEKGIPQKVELEEYTLLGMGLMYFAGALKLPFIPTKTMLGSDLLTHSTFLGEKKAKIIDDPFTGERVVALPPLSHDVGIIQVQRADENGNAQMWGVLGCVKYGINSCERIIVCAEEIVPSSVIEENPELTIVPGFRVCAVVFEPFGAHPTYIQGYYDRDWEYYGYYYQSTKTKEGFKKYMSEWVLDLPDRSAYLKKLGEDKVKKLLVKKSYQFTYGKYLEFPRFKDPF